MDPFVRRFIKASLGWLGFGVLLGIVMAFAPHTIAYRPAHVHANLLGFVSMMIFGVAYHIMPRFAGTQLHSAQLASLHFAVGNAGLVMMVGGWIGSAHALRGSAYVLRGGALLMAIGVFIFIYNIWRTLEPNRADVVTLQTSRRSA